MFIKPQWESIRLGQIYPRHSKGTTTYLTIVRRFSIIKNARTEGCRASGGNACINARKVEFTSMSIFTIYLLKTVNGIWSDELANFTSAGVKRLLILPINLAPDERARAKANRITGAVTIKDTVLLSASCRED